MNNTEDKNNQTVKRSVIGVSAYALIHFLAFIFAIYLVFKCNNGVSFLQLLAAICCPWIYIIYILVTRKGFCGGYIAGKPPVTVEI